LYYIILYYIILAQKLEYMDGNKCSSPLINWPK